MHFKLFFSAESISSLSLHVAAHGYCFNIRLSEIYLVFEICTYLLWIWEDAVPGLAWIQNIHTSRGSIPMAKSIGFLKHISWKHRPPFMILFLCQKAGISSPTSVMGCKGVLARCTRDFTLLCFYQLYEEMEDQFHCTCHVSMPNYSACSAIGSHGLLKPREARVQSRQPSQLDE